MRLGYVVMTFALATTSMQPAGAEDVAAKVKKAVERITLDQSGTPPFHLKAILAPSFERDKESGRNGEVEIWWASPDRWKREVRCAQFHQIQIVNSGREWQKNEGDYFPEWLREMAIELTTPVPDVQDVLAHVKTAEVKQMFGQLNIDWVINTGTADVRNIERAGLQFSPDGQLSFGFGIDWGGDFKEYRKFHNRMVAYKVSGLTPEVTATVTTLEDLGTVSESFFDTSVPGGDPQPVRTISLDETTFRKNLLSFGAVTWPTVENGPFQGNVTSELVVDREGKVREFLSVMSENAAMNDTGKEAVSKMRLQPFLLNGIPVQVIAQFTLPFRTGRPAGSEAFDSAQTYFEKGRQVGFLAAAQKSPYRLHADFQFGGTDGTLKTGHYEDTWLGEDQWVRRAEADNSFCTRSQHGDKRYRDTAGPWSGLMCLVLRMLEPVPAIDTFTESDWRIKREIVNGTRTIRVVTGPEGADGKLETQSRGFWFDESSGLLIKTYFNGFETQRSDFEEFNGVKIARQINVLKEGHLAMRITVGTVTPAPTVSADTFKLKGHEWERMFTDEVR